MAENQNPRIAATMDMELLCPGSSHLVEVTHVNDPKSFYIRLASLRGDLLPLETPGDLIAEKDIKPLRRIIFRSKVLNKYIRGDIVFILYRETSVLCTMFAVDYGFKEKRVPSKRMYLPDSDLDCPPLALHCQLSECEPKGNEFEEEAIDAMKFFVGTAIAKATIISKSMDKFTVELKTMECPDDVATTLGLLNFTSRTQPSPEPSSTNEPVTFKYKDLKVGERFCVRVQSGRSINSFYVAEVNDYKRYVKEGNAFSNYCKRQPLQDVAAAEVDGRCCGVKVNYLKKYERAIVEKVTEPGVKAIVKLVDWGKEIEVKFGRIKRVTSPRHTTQPAIAIHCSSDEDQVWETELPRFVYPGHQFTIEIVEVGNGADVPHKVNISPLGNPVV